jgi:hypothetical protein
MKLSAISHCREKLLQGREAQVGIGLFLFTDDQKNQKKGSIKKRDQKEGSSPLLALDGVICIE